MFMLIWIPSQLMYERSVSCTIEMIELFLSFHIGPGSAVLFFKSSISYLQMAFIFFHWEPLVGSMGSKFLYCSLSHVGATVPLLLRDGSGMQNSSVLVICQDHLPLA